MKMTSVLRGAGALLAMLLLAALAFQLAPPTTHAQGDPIRIMPLGDSITQADTRYNSYRRPLWFKFQDGGYNVDFVGTNTLHYGAHSQPNGPPPDPDFDMDHQGNWGWSALEVEPELPAWAAATQPDIVLMHLGTNDIFDGRTVQQTLTTLGDLIAILRDVNPNVVVFVATVIPHNRGDRPPLDDLVDAIPGFVTSQNTAQSPVLLVDQNEGFSAFSDTYDAVHPNAAGEEKMAQKWYVAVTAYLNDPSPPPDATPTPTLTPTSTPTPTITPTNTPVPTNTPAPTNTPTPVANVTFTESQLQAPLDAALSVHSGQVDFVLVNYIAGQMRLTVRTRAGTVGVVPVLMVHQSGIVQITFGAMTVGSGAAPADFVAAAHAELPGLLVPALDAMLFAAFGFVPDVVAIDFTDTEMLLSYAG